MLTCMPCEQIAVSTIKYLAELRGWNGISLPIV